MSAERAAKAVSALRLLYGRQPHEHLEDMGRANAEVTRMVANARANGEAETDLAAVMDQIARQYGGLQQAAFKCAAAVRALKAQGEAK